MEKTGTKRRDFIFYSPKNGRTLCVHSKIMRDYAQYLEHQPDILAYEPELVWDMQRYKLVSSVGIRKQYFATPWSSDFMLTLSDGRKCIREMVKADDLNKRATLEQLEFSRRYWADTGIADWKILLWRVKA